MKNLFILLMCSVFFITSCGENTIESITVDEAPDQVKVTKVENSPGKSRIYFNLPDSKSLLFVEAVFEDNGNIISAKSSSYTNYIELEGFSQEKEYNVSLYSVSRGMNKSEPLLVSVHPETPPYKGVLDAMNVKTAFGGLDLSFINVSSASLAVIVEKFDPIANAWQELETFYRQDPEATFKIRNQEGQNLQYRVRVRDKFLHYSDYKEFTVTPAVEAEMNYSLFAKVPLANDPLLFTITTSPAVYQPHEFLWNQKHVVTDQATNGGGWIGTASSGYTSYWISFDLGKQAQLTRLVLYQRGLSGTAVAPYTAYNLKQFEIWGSNNPSPDGSWDSWDRIMVGKINKPAGSPAELLEIAKKGDSFNFDEDMPSYRYLRIKEIDVFQNTSSTPLSARFYLAGIRLFEAL